jgi:hypothetical protein
MNENRVITVQSIYKGNTEKLACGASWAILVKSVPDSVQRLNIAEGELGPPERAEARLVGGESFP